MANVFTDAGVAYANLLAASYDTYLEYQLRSEPIFRMMVDKHPVSETNPGVTVTLSLMQEYAALATTPLVETVDPDAVAPPAPIRVTVTLNEYGNASLKTLKLKTLAFASVDPAIANLLGKNRLDTIDKLVQNVVDGGTYVLGPNGGVLRSQASGTAFSEAAVTGTDTFTDACARDAVALLRRRNAIGKDGADQYMAVMHPDVAVDVMSNNGWLNPHQYVDTTEIYRAEIGSYLGARYLVNPRATVVADGATSTKVYRTYYFGQQAIVEAMSIEPETRIGNQTDKLNRFFPIGWYALGGWSIYRQEAIQQVRTASSIGGI
jgi:N4-gp56 family major capsid protein